MARELAFKSSGGLSMNVDLFSSFSYKGSMLQVVPSYVYLGVLLHWLGSACDAGAAREATGWKAFGAITASLAKALFLPYTGGC